MRACCNKKEDNFITYHSTREKIIDDVRDWEKLNPEKRKEYTIKYYKTEKGHRKRLEQQKRYREKRKLIKENEKLKNDKMELLKKVDILQQENQVLKRNCNIGIKTHKTWLETYYYAIKSGNIIVGRELMLQLDKLIKDLDNPRYVYDTRESDARILFMETCCLQSKEPFYNKPLVLMLWEKCFIECVYSFKIAATGLDRFKDITQGFGNVKEELKFYLSDYETLEEFRNHEKHKDLLKDSDVDE